VRTVWSRDVNQGYAQPSTAEIVKGTATPTKNNFLTRPKYKCTACILAFHSPLVSKHFGSQTLFSRFRKMFTRNQTPAIDMAVPPRSYNPSSNITDMVNDAPPPTYFPRSYILEMENNAPPTPPPSYRSRSISMNSAPPPAYHLRSLRQQRVSALQRSHTRRPPDASKRKAK
jgi:hypothetical protein